MAEEGKPKKKLTFPTAFTILFLLLVVIALATWIVPAGSYDDDADGAPIPGTYHEVESNPQAPLTSALKGLITGMYGIEDETGNVDVWNFGELFGAIDVAMFVLIIGGFLGVTMKTGAINAGVAWVVDKLKGKEKWMFPILMTIFAIGSTSFGMCEESLAFYALIIAMMLAAGYDALSAGALILLGAGIGVLGSTVNPFATGIASGFASTTLSDGIVWRVVLLVVGTIIGIFFVMRYAEKVKKKPTKSLPIMAPLAQFQGVDPALIVTAYQAANGLVNLVTPMSAVVMGRLAIARVGYGVWIKFVALLLALLLILSVVVLAMDRMVHAPGRPFHSRRGEAFPGRPA